MASAAVVRPEPVPGEVVLTLSPEEARVLRDLLGAQEADGPTHNTYRAINSAVQGL